MQNGAIALGDWIFRVQAQQELAIDALVVTTRYDQVVAGRGSNSMRDLALIDVRTGRAATFELRGVQAFASLLRLFGVRVREDSVEAKLNELFARFALVLGAFFAREFLEK